MTHENVLARADHNGHEGGAKPVNYLVRLAEDLGFSKSKIASVASWDTQAALNRDEVVHTLTDIGNKIIAFESPARFGKDLTAFVHGTLVVWPKIRNQGARSQLDIIATTLIDREKKFNKLYAAEMLIQWKDTIRQINHNGEALKTRPPLSSLREVLEYVSETEFNEVGKIISKKLKHGNTLSYAEIFKTVDNRSPVAHLSKALLARIADTYIETGYLNKTKSGYALSERSRGREGLGYADVISVVMATDLLAPVPDAAQTFKTLADVETTQKRFLEQNRMKEVEMVLGKPNIRILFLSEALFGHKDLDITFLQHLVTSVKKLPKESLPDVIVASGFLQGGFQIRLKDQRRTLFLKSVNDQYSAARLLLNDLENLGVKVIYNMSSEDREICHNYTVEAMRMLNNYGKPMADKDKSPVTYFQLDKMKQNPAWDLLYSFQINVVFPYCLRSGRRLRSADEIVKLTGGKVRMEEYFMLLDTYSTLLAGGKPNPLYAKLLNLENIPLPGRPPKGFLITDDLNLKARLPGKEKTFQIRHNFKFNDKSMYQNPIDAAEAIAGQLSGHTNQKDGQLSGLIFEHQQQAVGIKHGETWIISTGGALKSNLDQSGTLLSVSGDSMWRQMTTRRILPTPAATMHEIGDDGSQKITFFTDHFIELANRVPDRTTLAFFNDWQNGSITARPDLQVKYADLVFRQYLPDHPTYLFFLGDIIQAQNYKGMSMENANIGLVRIDHQTAFVTKFLDLALADVPKEHLKHLRHVGIVPGNHEWNSGFQMYGSVYSHYPEELMAKLFLKKGITDAPIKFYDTMSTKSGEYLKVWAGFKEIAAHGVLFQHIMLEKGAKGGGDKAPIFQAQDFYSGMGDLVKPVDISIHGHWHFGQYALFADKLAVVSPALAGISGFEYVRGVRSDIGATLIHLGGGQPLTVEFLTPQSLYKHQIRNGYFSQLNLLSHGYKDDQHFDPNRNGFANRLEAHSALQKALWRIIDETLNNSQSTLG